MDPGDAPSDPTDGNRTAPPSTTRRRALLGAASLSTAALAGCTGLTEQLPVVGSGGDGSGDRALGTLATAVMGNPDADVTIRVWEDFACPHCREFTMDTLPKLRKQYIDPGEVRYEHHDIPFLGDSSWTAANAGRAVHEQNSDAFWDYSKRLYENQDSLGVDLYASVANEMGLNAEEVRNAAENRTYDDTLEADKQAAIDRGIEATPGILVNDTRVKTPSMRSIQIAIEVARGPRTATGPIGTNSTE
ncbi:thioredoxin [Halobacteriales archaeon QS_4_69_34]|nr:MAG: thioredoxin [Halobacteriales archaeon QS_4_69_34]